MLSVGRIVRSSSYHIRRRLAVAPSTATNTHNNHHHHWTLAGSFQKSSTTTTTTTTRWLHRCWSSPIYNYNKNKNNQFWLSQQPCIRFISYIRTGKVLLYSTSSSRNVQQQAVLQTTKSSSSSRWHRLASLIRYIRIPVLVVSVYSLGYQQGITDCSRTPLAVQEQIMTSILHSTNANANATTKPKIITEADVSMFSAYQDPHYQIAAVGQRIVTAARAYVDAEFEKALQKHVTTTTTTTTKSSREMPPNQVVAADILKKDPDVQFWYHARLRLEGESSVNQNVIQPWMYVVVESDAPNAFVTEMLPRRFFITTGLLNNIATNPNELAFVLGHEISHLILGHVSETNRLETALRTCEVLLLSMDPTAGILSLGVISGLWALRNALTASYSRDNETDADDLGLKITAQACFDTVAGVQVLRKMHNHGTATTTTTTSTSTPKTTATSKTTTVRQTALQIMDSHPPTLERLERLEQMAKDGENYTKYQNDQCANVTSRFYNALLWKKQSQ